MTDLKLAAQKIFLSALRAVEARNATRNAVSVKNSLLRVRETEIDIEGRSVYFVAIGKAASTMAAGLKDVLSDRIKLGIISGPQSDIHFPGWQTFAGGHPLPSEQSFAAARATLRVLKEAEADAVVIFLISGGGSAMFELPINDQITLDEIREANRQLISCGAAIREVNAVRRAFSAVKGGKLSSSSPHTEQITLIVSDTNPGDEANVASGPTIETASAISPLEMTRHYQLENTLPRSILNAIANPVTQPLVATTRLREHVVILDNSTALEAAAEKAKELGFAVEIAPGINEQEIDEGCDLLLSRAQILWSKSEGRPVCLLSGGEFSCPVRGAGVGGRNIETVLRCAMKLRELPARPPPYWGTLSAGTDGIDGNSDAAGAVADEITITQAESGGLDDSSYLERSDSFHFFEQLSDLVITGATGTNVRDLRVVLMGSRASRPQ